MKHNKYFFSGAVLLLFIFNSCTTARKILGYSHQLQSTDQLHFIGEYVLPYNLQFSQTTVGGLSGIDYDTGRDLYYMISDDRSAINPARFYTAKIFLNAAGIDSVKFTDVKSFLQKNGTVYPNSKQDPFHTPDPEAIRYNLLKDQFTWSSEGERIVKKDQVVLEDPTVISINSNGEYKDSFALPANMHMHVTENGPRQNGVFEGMSYSNDYRYLFVNVEEPLYEDGPRAGINDSTGWIRIIKFDVLTNLPVAQYAYQIEPVAHLPSPADGFKINGVPDILYAGNNKLLIIERSFSTGRLACTIRIFLADLSNATDISAVNSIPKQITIIPAQKKLLLNMDSLGIFIDNIEGVTFGPVLPNGHQTLVFVADNNFNQLQKNQFLFFEIVPQ